MLLACWILAVTQIGTIEEEEVVVDAAGRVETAIVVVGWRKSPDSAKRRGGNGALLLFGSEIEGAHLPGGRVLVVVVFWQGELVRVNAEMDELNGLW